MRVATSTGAVGSTCSGAEITLVSGVFFTKETDRLANAEAQTIFESIDYFLPGGVRNSKT